jgi:hypothetical protein
MDLPAIGTTLKRIGDIKIPVSSDSALIRMVLQTPGAIDAWKREARSILDRYVGLIGDESVSLEDWVHQQAFHWPTDYSSYISDVMEVISNPGQVSITLPESLINLKEAIDEWVSGGPGAGSMWPYAGSEDQYLIIGRTAYGSNQVPLINSENSEITLEELSEESSYEVDNYGYPHYGIVYSDDRFKAWFHLRNALNYAIVAKANAIDVFAIDTEDADALPTVAGPGVASTYLIVSYLREQGVSCGLTTSQFSDLSTAASSYLV